MLCPLTLLFSPFLNNTALSGWSEAVLLADDTAVLTSGYKANFAAVKLPGQLISIQGGPTIEELPSPLLRTSVNVLATPKAASSANSRLSRADLDQQRQVLELPPWLEANLANPSKYINM